MVVDDRPHFSRSQEDFGFLKTDLVSVDLDADGDEEKGSVTE
jgi:hypothetical protein